MKSVDYVYRFDPDHPTLKASPVDASAARKLLEEGNQMFSRWMANCRDGGVAPGSTAYIVPCNALEVGMVRKADQTARQAPFAVVVGCSDARVPIEMLFGQGFNDIFAIRVAGNVLGDVCMGSIDFALTALIESVKVVVMLGHSGCGAVTAAVDSYLEPLKFWSKTTSPALRSIQEHLFVAVREAAKGIHDVWGASATDALGYRSALIESAVAINAAQAAFDLRQETERMGRPSVEVFFGVYDLLSYQVCMPVIPGLESSGQHLGLAPAPRDPAEFTILARQMAKLLQPHDLNLSGRI